jgi:hypothetical protein
VCVWVCLGGRLCGRGGVGANTPAHARVQRSIGVAGSCWVISPLLSHPGPRRDGLVCLHWRAQVMLPRLYYPPWQVGARTRGRSPASASRAMCCNRDPACAAQRWPPQEAITCTRLLLATSSWLTGPTGLHAACMLPQPLLSITARPPPPPASVGPAARATSWRSGAAASPTSCAAVAWTSTLTRRAPAGRAPCGPNDTCAASHLQKHAHKHTR